MRASRRRVGCLKVHSVEIINFKFLFLNRNTVELFKQRQKVVEEKEKMRRDTRYNLMAQVEEIESELGQALEERKELMSLIM